MEKKKEEIKEERDILFLLILLLLFFLFLLFLLLFFLFLLFLVFLLLIPYLCHFRANLGNYAIFELTKLIMSIWRKIR